MNNKKIELILRIGVFGEFAGHGIFALEGKKQWVGWIQQFTGADAASAATLLALIGILDLIVAFIILVKPIKVVILWAAFWGFWTALVRPLVGEPFWDFIERSANWAAPLALLFLRGMPRKVKDLLSS